MMSKKLISVLLVIILSASAVLNCFAEENDKSSVLTELFIHQELFRQYSLIYDTFNASIILEDGTEITGIGFSDYSAYYEAEDGSFGFFPAGFIADCGYEIPDAEVEKGLVIENLDFSDEKHQFVFDHETTPFLEHCVREGQYLKYGVNALEPRDAAGFHAQFLRRGSLTAYDLTLTDQREVRFIDRLPLSCSALSGFENKKSPQLGFSKNFRHGDFSHSYSALQVFAWLSATHHKPIRANLRNDNMPIRCRI